MAAWPPLTMKDVVGGHERSLTPSPSPAGEGRVVSRCRTFHGNSLIRQVQPVPAT